MDNYVAKRLDGRYEIQEIIGVGGMSVVYKAYDNIDDRIVAVKILKDEFLANEEFRRRFKNESKAIAVMSHPNIVKVYDVNFGEKLQYIVMEHVDGITLKEYIQRQGVVSWREALHFTNQILRGLQHAHDKGIVHRDIKPQNIILLQNGNIKVTDFGIARFSRSETRTMTEKAIGSVHYISPEQARGDMTDEKADIYSVGVVLYEMITGTVPFESDSAVSVAIMQLQSDALLPTQVNPEIPKGLEQITMHAMQKLPADRYQTATEMLMDIDELSRNPDATFDYSYYVDSQPTKYVTNIRDTGELEYEEEPYDEEEEDEDYDYSEDPNRQKKLIAAIAAGALALIAAIVILVLVLTSNGGTVRVQDFTGLDYENEIQPYTYDYIIEPQYEMSNDYAAGSVIEQDPEPGTRINKGDTVTVFIATKEDAVTVPDVTGKTLQEARTELTAAGLPNYSYEEIPSDDVEAGNVIYTSPRAGESMASNERIIIYVSTGTENDSNTLTMPDLTGLSRSDAESVLKSRGFTNIYFSTQDSDKPANQVISQTPSAGNSVSANSTIRVTVSTGNRPTTATTTTTTAKAEETNTTTTAPSTGDINISVSMPNIEGASAQVYIYAGTRQIESGTHSLSGEPVNVTYTAEIGTEVTIRVEIGALGYSSSQTIKVANSNNVTFDASGYTLD